MTNDVKERVRTLSAAGVAPAQILTLIRSEPSGEHVIARDVYNLKRQHRIEQLDGWTPMEALFSSLIKLDVPNTLVPLLVYRTQYKAETEVVRIKGRRRDKGGGGWEKQISKVGGSAP
jgi:hypothetical protein